LVFFHFSSYSYANSTQLAKIYDRYKDLINDNVLQLYAQYHTRLIENNVEALKDIPCHYGRKPAKPYFDKYYYLRKFVPPIFIEIKNAMSAKK
jgi:hypothetical protein